MRSVSPSGGSSRVRPLRDGLVAGIAFLVLKLALILVAAFFVRELLVEHSRTLAQRIAIRAAAAVDSVTHSAILEKAEAKIESSSVAEIHDSIWEALSGDPTVTRIRTFDLQSPVPRGVIDSNGSRIDEDRDIIRRDLEELIRVGEQLVVDIERQLIFGPTKWTAYAPIYKGAGNVSGAVAVDVEPRPLHFWLQVLWVVTVVCVVLAGLSSFLLGRHVWRQRHLATEAENALARSQKAEFLVMETLGEISYERTGDGSAILWRGNPDAAFGLRLEDLPASSSEWEQLIHPEDRPAYCEAVSRALVPGGSLQIEYRLNAEAGDPIWILDRARFVDLGGNAPSLIGALANVTSIREASEALRAFIDQSPTPHLFFAGDEILDCNPAAARLFGRKSVADLMRCPVWSLWPKRQPRGELSAAVWSEHVVAALDGVQQHFEWQFVREDRAELYLDVFFNPARFGDRDAVLMAGYDLSEARKAQSKLIESEQRFQDVSRAVGEFIWEVDAEGRYTYASSRVEDILGFKPDEVVGHHPFEWVPDEDRAGVEQQSLEIVTSADGFKSFEHPIRRRDGALLWVEVSGGPRFDSDGNLVGYRGATLDITERRAYEKALVLQKEAAEAADRAKSNFLAMMSHEIRTPLNSVIGFSELVLKTDLNASQRESLEIVRKSGESLLILLNDILDFSKIESGRMEISPDVTDLRELITDIVGMYRLSASAKGLEIRTEIAPVIPAFVLIDAPRLRQVLVNLIGNAIKFTDAGSVRISADRCGSDGSGIRFEVADTGIGVTEAQRPRLFQPFTQADSSMNRKFGGTGLGLVISRRLAELMGGTLGLVERDPPGATFYLELPLVEAEGRESPQPASPISSPVGALPARMIPLRVLVVDDNSINRRLTTRILDQFGAVNESAKNADECFKKLESGEFDVILMDIQMPGTDGLEATRMIRAREKAAGTRPTTIVALTAGVLSVDRKRCLEAGMDDYLTKPIRSGELASLLGRLQQEP